MTTSMKHLIKEISEHFHLDPNYTHKIDKLDSNVKTAVNTSNTKVFIKLRNALPQDSDDDNSSQTNTVSQKDYNAPEIKSFQKEWGKKEINIDILEHTNKIEIEEDLSPNCALLVVSPSILQNFVDTAQKQNFSIQRLAFLFGRANSTVKQVNVHCIYEPTQMNGSNSVNFNRNMTVPLEIAKLLNMECVGMVVSHRPVGQYLVPQNILKFALEYQNVYCVFFTTLIVTLSTTTKIEAFQAHSKLMIAQREGLITQGYSNTKLYFEKKN